MAALYLLLTGAEPAAGRRRRARRGADVRPAVSPEEAIGYLRERRITLIYDPDAGTLRADGAEAAKTITGRAS
jgi:hypothetical protein